MKDKSLFCLTRLKSDDSSGGGIKQSIWYHRGGEGGSEHLWVVSVPGLDELKKDLDKIHRSSRQSVEY
jgi:hypothetical protein